MRSVRTLKLNGGQGRNLTWNYRRPPQIRTDDESAQARDAARQLARLLRDGQRPLRLVAEGDGRESISIRREASESKLF